MAKSENTRENVSKNKLVVSGKALFYKFGYRKVTVEEICEAAGVSKMTFYRFFENKNDLVKHILMELAQDGVKAYQAIMSQDIPFEDKIRETMLKKREAAKQYSEEFLNDVYRDQGSDILVMLKKMSAESMVLVMQDYKKAQEQGCIRKDLNLAVIPYIMNKMNEMIQDPAMLAIYGNNIHDIMTELSNVFFYGILGHENNCNSEK
jgi:AcrR family transcriptional regulator